MLCGIEKAFLYIISTAWLAGIFHFNTEGFSPFTILNFTILQQQQFANGPFNTPQSLATFLVACDLTQNIPGSWNRGG